MLTTINKKKFSNKIKTKKVLNKSYYRLHKSDKSKIQKVLIKINHNAYIAPHYHKKDEMLVILEGLCGLVIFDSKGNKNDFCIISSEKNNKENRYHYGYQINANTYHTLVSLTKESVLLEIKNGPFNEKNNKFIPYWAPKVDSNESKFFLKKLKLQLRENL
jgi:cupin fold WbuC family metalloprotein